MSCLKCFFVCAVACVIASNVRGGSSSFAVDSYTPSRFSDLVWKVDGGLNLNGMAEDESREPPSFLNKTWSGSSQGVNFRSNTNYTLETIPRSFSISFNVGIDASRNRSSIYDSSQHATPTITQRITERREGSREDYRLSANSVTNLEQYLLGDLFSGLYMNWYWSYTEIPGTDNSREHHSYWQNEGASATSLWREESTFRRTARSAGIDIRLVTGIGRIYEGWYAATALEVIEALRRDRLLLREPNPSEMFILTDMIYRARETQAIDDRLHRIQSLDHIMSYLRDNGVIADTGPYGFLLIQDIWDYYPTERRRFGLKAKAGIGVRLGTSDDDQSETGSLLQSAIYYYPDNDPPYDTAQIPDEYSHINRFTHQRSKTVCFLGELAYCRPISLRWQFNTDFSVEYRPESYQLRIDRVRDFAEGTDTGERKYRQETNDWLSVSLNTEWVYLFDNRTTVLLAALTDYRGEWTTNTDTDIFQATLYPGITYRLSVPTSVRLSGRFTYSDMNRSVTNTERWSYAVSASISHYLY